MKKIFKLFALVIAATLIISSFGACTSKVVKTGDKFTYWTSLDTASSQTLTSFNELLMYQEMTKRTGIEVEFIHPASGTTGSEAFQILMSSGDYPDMIEYYWKSYTGGPDQAIKDSVIISLNKYMEDYAPNYYDYMEGEKAKDKDYLYKATGLSNQGNYFGFCNLSFGTYGGYFGIYVRGDLLEKWGLDIPETIDEWETVFKTAKENGVKYPLTGTSNIVGVLGVNIFNTAWEVGTDFYLSGDKVKFGPFEPEFKEYVKKMREWMEKGYIDIDYVTNDKTIVHGQIANGTSIATTGYVGGDLGVLIPAMKERNPEFDLVGCPFPVMKKGDEAIFQNVGGYAGDPTVAITVQCGKDNEDRYKEAISWCDYLYSEEGMILKSFGIEGDTFTIEEDENGEKHYVYTDKITKNYNEYGAQSIEAALYHHFLPANHPGLSQHPDYLKGFYEYDRQKEAIDVWNKYYDVAQKNVFPPVSYTGEEASQKAVIESAGKANLQAAISNIILGKASMDTYDKAISDAKKAGYDKLLKINQEAYNRYISVIRK